MAESTKSSAQATSARVQIVDDDQGMRESLRDLLSSVGYEVEVFQSAAEFLQQGPDRRQDCLILDIRLPGVSGLDLQEQLIREGRFVPIIFITGHGDIPMSVRGMKAGAIDFLEKPFREQDLLDAVALAVEEGRRAHQKDDLRNGAQQRFDNLSAREREVIGHVLNGRLSKQIAFDLHISEITVKIHRAAAMKKLGVRSLIELTRLVESLGQ